MFGKLDFGQIFRQITIVVKFFFKNLNFSQYFPKISIFDEIVKNLDFCQKISHNLDYGQNF